MSIEPMGNIFSLQNLSNILQANLHNKIIGKDLDSRCHKHEKQRTPRLG
jgi:hypothetical protein